MLTQMGALWNSTGPMSVSQYFLAIDVTRFLPMEEFCERMQFIRNTVTASRPASGYEEVLIAGDPEWRAESHRTSAGIPIPRAIWQQLAELGSSVRAPVPAVS